MFKWSWHGYGFMQSFQFNPGPIPMICATSQNTIKLNFCSNTWQRYSYDVYLCCHVAFALHCQISMIAQRYLRMAFAVWIHVETKCCIVQMHEKICDGTTCYRIKLHDTNPTCRALEFKGQLNTNWHIIFMFNLFNEIWFANKGVAKRSATSWCVEAFIWACRQKWMNVCQSYHFDSFRIPQMSWPFCVFQSDFCRQIAARYYCIRPLHLQMRWLVITLQSIESVLIFLHFSSSFLFFISFSLSQFFFYTKEKKKKNQHYATICINVLKAIHSIFLATKYNIRTLCCPLFKSLQQIIGTSLFGLLISNLNIKDRGKNH